MSQGNEATVRTVEHEIEVGVHAEHRGDDDPARDKVGEQTNLVGRKPAPCRATELASGRKSGAGQNKRAYVHDPILPYPVTLRPTAAQRREKVQGKHATNIRWSWAQEESRLWSARMRYVQTATTKTQ